MQIQEKISGEKNGNILISSQISEHISRVLRWKMKIKANKTA